MSCADCVGEMVECVDCRADSAYAAAREEGRREGYAQGLADAQDKAIIVGDDLAPHHDSALGRMLAAARAGSYAACTADVVAHIGKRYRRRWPGATPTGEIVRAELQLVEDSIALGEHVGAAGKGKP